MLKDYVDTLIRNEAKKQDFLYESIVVPALDEPERLGEVYDQYLKQLGHFNVVGYRKTVDIILNDLDDTEFEQYQDLFSAIPDYASARNNFQSKIKDIMDMDGSKASKQDMIDTLDRQRTRAHDRVITLFNKMNDLAAEHRIASPYPNFGSDFDKTNPVDRETVADILIKQETIMESVNQLVQTREIDKHDYKSMSPSELLKHAYQMDNFSTILEQLTESDPQL